MKIKKSDLKFFGILLRYFILILVALFDLWIFYAIFTPLTVYPVYFLTKIFFDVSLLGNTILINRSIPIELIKACIAGSAYYLLFVFNISIPGIKYKKRIKMVIFSFVSLLILNILRIFLLILIYMQKSSIFDITHKIFWYAFGTIFVVGIWFSEAKIFNVKSIPVYSDIKFLIDKIKEKR